MLGSRICHDLISPLGAIGNGVELLGLTGTDATPELELIAQSVDMATARIRFFRIAFGAAAADQGVPLDEIRGIVAQLSAAGRISIRWSVGSGLIRPRVKLAFLLLQCLESAMPFGGDITVEAAPDGAWVLTGTADRLQIEDEPWRLLDAPESDAPISAALVHFALVAPAATDAGRSVVWDATPTRIRAVC